MHPLRPFNEAVAGRGSDHRSFQPTAKAEPDQAGSQKQHEEIV